MASALAIPTLTIVFIETPNLVMDNVNLPQPPSTEVPSGGLKRKAVAVFDQLAAILATVYGMGVTLFTSRAPWDSPSSRVEFDLSYVCHTNVERIGRSHRFISS